MCITGIDSVILPQFYSVTLISECVLCNIAIMVATILNASNLAIYGRKPAQLYAGVNPWQMKREVKYSSLTSL